MEKEILEGNKLIAEFMEGILVEISDGENYLFKIPPDARMYSLGDTIYDGSDTQFYLNELDYHNSWDWLMPVVQKIGGIDNYSVHMHWGTGCTDSFAWCIMYDGSRQIISDELNADEQSLITAIYKACVEFIKWYNNGRL